MVKRLGLRILTALLCAMALTGPALAYETLEADYKNCTSGAGKIPNGQIVSACTRLIDNAQAENELVGFFYALRASSNSDKAQNCSDARKAQTLIKAANLQENIQALIRNNC
jgi:hypothetical protein